MVTINRGITLFHRIPGKVVNGYKLSKPGTVALADSGNYAEAGFVLRSGRSLEAGGIEPPSVIASLRLLRACSVL